MYASSVSKQTLNRSIRIGRLSDSVEFCLFDMHHMMRFSASFCKKNSYLFGRFSFSVEGFKETGWLSQIVNNSVHSLHRYRYNSHIFQTKERDDNRQQHLKQQVAGNSILIVSSSTSTSTSSQMLPNESTGSTPVADIARPFRDRSGSDSRQIWEETISADRRRQVSRRLFGLTKQ